jgi:hypothetical protein
MYKVIKINDNNSWNSQIEKSPQYSLFCSTLFLDGLKTQFEKYFIYDDKDLVMAFCTAIFDDKNKKLFYKDFHYNQSFYFFKNFNKERSLINYQLKLTSFLIDFILKNFKKIRLSLHYSIKDIRSFLFYNFNNNKNFKIELKYSFIINLLQYKDFTDYLNNIRPSRRQDYKYFFQDEYKILYDNNFEYFKNLYKIKFPNETKKNYQSVFFLIENLIKQNLCRINFAKKHNKFFACTVFIFDKKSSYYLHGFSINNNEKFSILTSLILDQIRFSFLNHIENVDMCGANSPKRSDFKSGFDGKLKHFFEISYEQ